MHRHDLINGVLWSHSEVVKHCPDRVGHPRDGEVHLEDLTVIALDLDFRHLDIGVSQL